MTIQEAFNKVYRHFVYEGGKPSFKGAISVTCMLRDCDGNKCAIGLLIPDVMYDRSLETCSLTRLINETGLELEIDDAIDLQNLHDNSVKDAKTEQPNINTEVFTPVFLKYFKQKALALSERRNLTIPEG